MPYADPEKRKQAALIRAKKSKLNQKMRRLQGQDGPGSVASPAPAEQLAAAGTLPEGLEDVPTPQEFALRKVRLGLAWIQKSEDLILRAPSAAFQMGKAGIELVNANLSAVCPRAEGGVQAGSVLDCDPRFFEDREYRQLAEALLARKCDLQLEWEAAQNP